MTSYIPLITGSAGALVVLVFWISLLLTGQLHTNTEFSKLDEENTSLREENAQLRAALDAERRSASDLAHAGTVTNQLISALTELAAEKRVIHAPVISAKELGL